jgi:hypothetical protein
VGMLQQQEDVRDPSRPAFLDELPLQVERCAVRDDSEAPHLEWSAQTAVSSKFSSRSLTIAMKRSATAPSIRR